MYENLDSFMVLRKAKTVLMNGLAKDFQEHGANCIACAIAQAFGELEEAAGISIMNSLRGSAGPLKVAQYRLSTIGAFKVKPENLSRVQALSLLEQATNA